MGLNPITWGAWSLFDMVVVTLILGIGSGLGFLTVTDVLMMGIVVVAVPILVNLIKEFVPIPQ